MQKKKLGNKNEKKKDATDLPDKLVLILRLNQDFSKLT